jgi:acid phosphatase
MISTVSLNWGLPSLGRWDCNANVLQTVANKTSHVNTIVNTTNLYFNSSYPGPMSDGLFLPVWPVPDTNAKCIAGSVLSSVVTTWGKSSGTYNYTNGTYISSQVSCSSSLDLSFRNVLTSMNSLSI